MGLSAVDSLWSSVICLSWSVQVWGQSATCASKDCSLEGMPDNGLRWQSLPRIPAAELTYERFLIEFALPRKPFVLTGADREWTARERWNDPRYFLTFPHVFDPLHEVQVVTFAKPLGPEEGRDHFVVSDAIERLVKRGLADCDIGNATCMGLATKPVYLRDWEYTWSQSGDLPPLAADIRPIPHFFDRTPAHVLTAEVLAENMAPTDNKWIFMGEPGTGTTLHTDTFESSAWLWLARGRKSWRIVHGGDMDALMEDVRRQSGILPDLSAPAPRDGFPSLRQARLYFHQQVPGEVVYTPSGAFHQVLAGTSGRQARSVACRGSW